MYNLKCRYKDIVFLPYVAISDNIDFLCDKSTEIQCITADKVPCLATYVKEINILSEDAKQLVKKLYDVDIFDYLYKWYQYNNNVQSLMFLEIHLKRIDGDINQ